MVALVRDIVPTNQGLRARKDVVQSGGGDQRDAPGIDDILATMHDEGLDKDDAAYSVVMEELVPKHKVEDLQVAKDEFGPVQCAVTL